MRASSLHLISIAFALCACEKSPDAPPTTQPDDATAQVSESDPGPGPRPTGDGSDPEAPTADDPTDVDDPDDEPVGRSPGDPVSVPEDPADGLSKPTSFANIKLEVKLSGGKVHRDEGKVIRWEELTRIPLDVDGQKHEFIVFLTREGGKAEIMMSYNVDGSEVLRKHTFDAKIKKREVLRIDDGSALALTITPETVKPHTSSHEKVKKVEGDDPLVGAGKKREPKGDQKKKKKKKGK